MSQFKHKPNTGSLFYQEDNKGSPKPNWKGKIVIDDDVLKMLIDDRKTNEEPPILNLAGWQDGNNARINLKTSTWKPEPKADFNSPSNKKNILKVKDVNELKDYDFSKDNQEKFDDGLKRKKVPLTKDPNERWQDAKADDEIPWD